MGGGAWWAAVRGFTKSQTWPSDFTFTFHFHALEKEMAAHSSVLAWRIPGTGEPGGLPSMWSHRVGHDWSDLAAAAWRRKWLPTPVFLLGKFHGQRSLAGYGLWAHTELDMTEWLIHTLTHTHTHTHTHTQTFHFRFFLQNIKCSSLCCTVDLCWLFYIY